MAKMDTTEVNSLLHEKLAVDACMEAFHGSLENSDRTIKDKDCQRCGSDEGQWRGYRGITSRGFCICGDPDEVERLIDFHKDSESVNDFETPAVTI